MHSGITQLKKLRGRSLRELRTRGRQELAKVGEQLLGLATAEMSDAAWRSELIPQADGGSGEAAAARLLARLRASVVADPAAEHHLFFPPLLRREEIVATMERRFADERRALIERADRALSGRFDLLGLSGLSFGDPIDWHFEPTSGKRTPLDHWSRIDYLNPEVAGDKKITWELNRHGHFVTLGQAYWLTGEERYAAGFVSQISSWMDANPPNRGINWASSLELALRAVAWLWALHLLAASPQLTARLVLRLLKHLVAHGCHIASYLSHYFSPNTHLTGEALGLFYLGTALPELRRAGAWRRAGLGILLEQLPRQVRPDGVYFEQASYYHRYTADFYLHLAVLAHASDLRLGPEVEEKLTLLLDHLMWITRPDGTSPLFGDDDGGRLVTFGRRRPDDFRDTLAVGAALFGRRDWKAVAGAAAVETLWLLGPAGLERYDQMEPERPVEHARAFGEGGCYVMRDGWESAGGYTLIDGGPHGTRSGGHAHADALSFEFAARGVTWLVDPGTFNYTGDRHWRDWFRSTAAHNTVTVDDEPQSTPAGPFSWRRVAQAKVSEFIAADGCAYFEGSHDGYRRLADPVTHTRSIFFVKAGQEPAAGGLFPYLLVRDAFTAEDFHTYQARYHFAPECSALADAGRVRASSQAGQLNLFAYGRSAPRTRVSTGWVSRGYGQRESAPVAVIETEGTGPQELLTLLIPTAPGETVSVERHACERPGADAFSIVGGEWYDLLLVDHQESEVAGQPLAASGILAWGRFAEGKCVGCCLVGGKRLEVAGKLAITSPGVIRFCAVRLDQGQVEISIDGAGRFDLSLDERAGRVIVNGSEFEAKGERMRFIVGRLGWELSAFEK